MGSKKSSGEEQILKKKLKKRRAPSSSSESDSSLISIDDELKEKLLKKLRKSRKKEKKRKKKKKEKKEKIRLTERKHEKEEKKHVKEVPNDMKHILIDTEKSKKYAPMTKEEWEAQQNTLTRVYDKDTGRTRLMRGTGEIVEECVSRKRQIEINKQATMKDGEYFQKMIAVKEKTNF